MDKFIENRHCVEAQDDELIVLGIASVETMGSNFGLEVTGGEIMPGLSDE